LKVLDEAEHIFEASKNSVLAVECYVWVMGGAEGR
jgi:hypothetical protein